MSNLKSITDLPLATSPEGLNLIVNDGGAAKQIAASAVGAQADWAEMNENSPSFIKNKPTIKSRELIYSQEFSLEEEVQEFIQNLDNIAEYFNNDTSLEIEIAQYGYNLDSGVLVDDCYCANINIGYNKFFNVNVGSDDNPIIGNILRFYNWDDGYSFTNNKQEEIELGACAHAELISNIQFDLDEGIAASSSNNGIIGVQSYGSGPFKYIKLYKIT